MNKLNLIADLVKVDGIVRALGYFCPLYEVYFNRKRYTDSYLYARWHSRLSKGRSST
jgi:hypothetical protein